MSKKTGLFGRAMSFAHLAGVKTGAKRAEDTDDTTTEDEDTDPAAEDEDEPPKSKKAKSARRAEDKDDESMAEDDDDDTAAEGDDDDTSAEGDDDDTDAEDDEDPPKSKKAKGSRASTAEFRRGRLAERQRCARIFGSPAAGRNPAAAAELAFNTNLTSSAAISVLKTTGGSSAAARSRGNPDLGTDSGSPDPARHAGKGWDKALANVAGKGPAARGWGDAFAQAGGRTARR
jgi:hypothetical protein